MKLVKYELFNITNLIYIGLVNNLKNMFKLIKKIKKMINKLKLIRLNKESINKEIINKLIFPMYNNVQRVKKKNYKSRLQKCLKN